MRKFWTYEGLAEMLPLLSYRGSDGESNSAMVYHCRNETFASTNNVVNIYFRISHRIFTRSVNRAFSPSI